MKASTLRVYRILHALGLWRTYRLQGLKPLRERRESTPPASRSSYAHALVDAPACEEDIARGDTAAVHEISEGRYSCTPLNVRSD